MTILSLVGAASSATSLEYKIVFEMLGVLLLLLLLRLPLLPSVVAGNPGYRGFGLRTVSSEVSQRYTLHYRVYRMPQTKYAVEVRRCIVARISLPRTVDNAPNISFAKRATKGDGEESYVCTTVTTDVFEMEGGRWKISFCRRGYNPDAGR